MIEQKNPPANKQPYASPVIHVYGDIRTITQSFGKTGKPDGGSNVNGKNFTGA